MKKKIYNYSHNFYLKNKIFHAKNINQIKKFTKKKYSIVGNMKSYNDAAIGANPISIKKINKIIKFDRVKGIIEVEAGVLLKDFLKVILKDNFIIKALPGSRYVTIGGMVANNTQGKNVRDTFIRDYIVSIKILNNGKIVNCSKKINKKLFNITIGGKGCAGIILSVVFRLTKISFHNNAVLLKKISFKNFKEIPEIFYKNRNNYEYLVVWIDFFSNIFGRGGGRGIFFLANHVNATKKIKIRKEFKIPSLIIRMLNVVSNKKIFAIIFNLFFKINNYFIKLKLYNLYDFYFIQDTLINWNHAFKKKGFYQIQVVCRLEKLEKNICKIKKIKKF
jgi:hypothetical protein